MKKQFNKPDLLILVTSCITLLRWLQSGGALVDGNSGRKEMWWTEGRITNVACHMVKQS